VPFPGTTSYEVPVTQCHTCHDRKTDAVLGFEAALLAAPEADGFTWDSLVAENRVASAKPLPSRAALQFLGGGTALERSAVGYLHANCGVTCHHATSGETTPFFARLEPDLAGQMPTTIDRTSIFTTAMNQQSIFTPQGAALGSDYRIRPGDPTRSTLVYRMDVRDGEQMPPVVSHVVDTAGVQTMTNWIAAMTAAPYPAPAP
jgi:cytochrome c553